MTTELRYPVGQFDPAAPVSPDMREPAIRIVEELPAAEQRAYHEALSNSPSADEVGPDFDLDTPGQAGCLGEAHLALPGIFRLPPELDDAVSGTRAEAFADPAVVEDAWRQGRACTAREPWHTYPCGTDSKRFRR